MLEIRKSSIAELEGSDNINDILNEYAAESSIDGMPCPLPNAEMYKTLEKSGTLIVFSAFLDKCLIGYITVLTTYLPHYSALTSIIESFFVSAYYRKTGAGLKLLHEAEKFVQSIGSVGCLISAPKGGILADVLPRCGYKETNLVFFRRLND